MNFIAIDVETANPRMSSICQIGLVQYKDGQEVRGVSLFVNPLDYFDSFNVSLHGIDENAVADAYTYGEIYESLSMLLCNRLVVCHTHFDRIALAQASDYYGLDPISCDWLDTAKVARRAWPQFANRGYGLSSLAKHFGIAFQHHNALHDARAAALILLKAAAETGLGLDDWRRRVEQPISLEKANICREGGLDGPLTGELTVFTGSLQIPRHQAADLAQAAGSAVAASVTSKTTLLIVGDQDLGKLAGKTKSAKHLKAETLIARGQPIRIMQETDFMAVVAPDLLRYRTS